VSPTWLAIRVDLVAGHGEMLWPRPGRIFAAARAHTFAQLATAIDDAFARWDRSHLHQFTRADGSELGMPSDEDELSARVLDYRQVKLGQLQPGEQFAYVFDFGDQWEHLCTVGPQRIEPIETLGIRPDRPLPYFGWGTFLTSTADSGTAMMVRVPDHADPDILIFYALELAPGPALVDSRTL
jgi:Plasmid pRiA4b ORF-3-like protein